MPHDSGVAFPHTWAMPGAAVLKKSRKEAPSLAGSARAQD